jgi:RimJ/RimL family protein N-acetyltransferase
VVTPTFTDQVVVLDGHSLADTASHLAGEDEEQARRFGWFPKRSTEATVRAAIERWQEQWRTGGPTRAFAVREAATGRLVGGCEVRLGERGVATMSYWVFPLFRGRGYATRAVGLVCDYAFSELAVRLIELHVAADNSASRGVARRAGFVERPGPARQGELGAGEVLYVRTADGRRSTDASSAESQRSTQLQADPPVVRIGDTVCRESSGSAVHALLAHLERVGFPYSPRLLGIDEEGREVLTCIDGLSGRDSWAQVVPDAGLRAFARLLRAYHDAVAGYLSPVHEWALAPRPLRAGEVICHGDFGPWNVVWRDGQPVGLIDFEFARPAPPLTDVAYALEYSVPFRDDEDCLRWLGYRAPPDRRARLETFADAYGLPETIGLPQAVVENQRAGIDHVRRLAAAGREPQTRWVAEGYLESLARRVVVAERIAKDLR